MVRHILDFFDKLEDVIRHALSRRPLLYALVGGTGVVLFWRGVWHLTDWVLLTYFVLPAGPWDGLLSILAGLIILLATGLFASVFVGDAIIISGLRGEKKMIDKAEHEIKSEVELLTEATLELKKIEKKIEEL
jgi:sensor histidine kinase YesM